MVGGRVCRADFPAPELPVGLRERCRPASAGRMVATHGIDRGDVGYELHSTMDLNEESRRPSGAVRPSLVDSTCTTEPLLR